MSAKGLRRALLVVGALVLFAVALVVGARLHLSLPVGRRAAADALEALVSSEIPGTMRIGRIEVLRTDLVRAHDVVFETPEGEEALLLREIELDPDLRRLVREGVIATRSARIQGAVMHMIEREGEDGLGLERAFDNGSEGGGESQGEGGGGGIALDLANVAFRDLDSDWQVGDAPQFHLDDASGLARFYTDEQGQIAMRFDRIAARARTEGLPMNVRADIESASGRIRTGWRLLGVFDIRVALLGSDVDLELRLIDGEGGVRPRIRTDVDPGSLGMFAMLGLDLITNAAGEPDAVQVGQRGGDDEEDAK